MKEEILKLRDIVISSLMPDIVLLLTFVMGIINDKDAMADNRGLYGLLVIITINIIVIVALLVSTYLNKREYYIRLAILRLSLSVTTLLGLLYFESYIVKLYANDFNLQDIHIISLIGVLIVISIFHMIWLMLKYSSKTDENYNRLVYTYGLPPILLYMIMNIDMISDTTLPLLCIVVLLMLLMLFITFIQKGFIRKIDENPEKTGVILVIASMGGLFLNASVANIFGNFTHPLFFILDFLVCTSIFIRVKEDDKSKVCTYIFRCITFSFTLYFFIIFIPYIPLSIPGILVFGLGLLILAPVLLAYVHTRLLIKDFNNVARIMGRAKAITLGVVFFMILPGIFTCILYVDKGVLREANDYIYSRNYNEEEANFRIASIKRSINNLKKMNSDRDSDDINIFVDDDKIPIISKLYNDIVLDGLSLPRGKLDYLENIYLGVNRKKVLDERGMLLQSNEDINISDIKVETEYNEEGYYESWIHIKIENSVSWNNEYHTEFVLPDSAVVSDYYLDVFRNRKEGLIADKRAANWIYNRVKRKKRDPGLLCYKDSNTLSFSVFPFSKNEIRETGLKIIHRRDININIDGNDIILKGDNFDNKPVEMQWGSIIPKDYKKKLTKTKREKEYYFIIDGSKDERSKLREYKERVNNYIKNKGLSDDNIQEITIQNYRNYDIDDSNFKSEGGFYIDHKIKSIWFENYMTGSDKQPVVIAVTDEPLISIVGKDISNFRFIAPEGLIIKQLDKTGELYSIDLKRNRPIHDEDKPVYVYVNDSGKKTYLEVEDRDSVIINKSVTNYKVNNKYDEGIKQHGRFYLSKLYPGDSNQLHLQLVKDSIKSNTINPLTAFIVLENKNQEALMFEKQQKLLNDNYEDFTMNYQVMDEPNLYYIVGGLFLTMLYLKGRGNRKKKKIFD